MSFSIQGAQIASHIQDCLMKGVFIFISWHAILHKLQKPTYRNKHLIPCPYRLANIFFTSVVDCADMADQKFLEISKFILAVWPLGEAIFALESKSQFDLLASLFESPSWEARKWHTFFTATKSLKENGLHKMLQWRTKERKSKKLLRGQPTISIQIFLQHNLREPSSLAASLKNKSGNTILLIFPFTHFLPSSML